MRRIAHLSVRGFCLLAALGIVGCPFSPEKREKIDDEEDTFLPRTSPQNLIYNLKQAYKERNVAEYESLLAQPDFTFLLSQEDQEHDLPDQWGRDSEIQIHTKMFDAEYVQNLTLDFVDGEVVWDPTDGLYTSLISNVNLFLYGSTPGHPNEVKEYRVSGDRSKFWFRKNGWTVPGTQDSVWSIVKWEDNPAGS